MLECLLLAATTISAALNERNCGPATVNCMMPSANFSEGIQADVFDTFGYSFQRFLGAGVSDFEPRVLVAYVVLESYIDSYSDHRSVGFPPSLYLSLSLSLSLSCGRSNFEPTLAAHRASGRPKEALRVDVI